jgi:hypothetical protein
MYICNAAEGWNHTRPVKINGFFALYPIEKKGLDLYIELYRFFYAYFFGNGSPPEANNIEN